MSKNSVSIDITEAAGDWLDRLDTDEKAERKAFTDWALRSPVHVEEFLRVSDLRAELSGALARHPEWVSELLAHAQSNVVVLHGTDANQARGSNHPRSRRWRGAAAVFAVMIIGGMFTWWQGFLTEDPSSMTTAVGEQRSVLLSDGSTIELNTESSVRIHLTEEAREITLVRGEAMFDVAKDRNRPFRVSSDGVVVEAIGTRFNVYRRNDETLVTVVEGRVAVNRERETRAPKPVIGVSASPSVELVAGMQIAVSNDDQALTPATANLEKATAWTERRLVFDDETVAVIVAEFNRYNREHLVIGDPVLGTRRLNGVFDANDPDEFIELLSSLEAIDVRAIEDGHRELVSAIADVER